MEHNLEIDRCGSNTVLGTLYNSDLCSIIQADGLTGLRKHLKKHKITITCKEPDIKEVTHQLEELKLDKLVTVTPKIYQ